MLHRTVRRRRARLDRSYAEIAVGGADISGLLLHRRRHRSHDQALPCDPAVKAGHLEVVTDAKTTASLRTLTAPPFLVDELALHLASHRVAARSEPDALVFVGPRGGVLRRRFGERILAPAVARAGIDPSLTFHALRHVAITAMVDAGVQPRVMQGRAGHATSKLTMELYAHVPDSADRQAAEALEQYHRPPEPPTARSNETPG